MHLPITLLPRRRQVFVTLQLFRILFGFSHFPLSSCASINSFSPSYELSSVFLQSIVVSSPSMSSLNWSDMFFLVILDAGMRYANSVFGLSIPSWMGLKKNGMLVLIGTTLSVNIFLASVPVFDRMPSLAFFASVAMFTHSDDDMYENPERRIFRYIIPKLRISALQASQNIKKILFASL